MRRDKKFVHFLCSMYMKTCAVAQCTRFHIDRIKRYYPNLISDKQIDFSIISQDNTTGVSDYHQYIRIDYSKLKLEKETIITENVCPTCKYDCSVYKCSRLHTYCELYSKYNDDNEDVFMFHDYYLNKPVPVSPKSRKLHPREIIKHRCGLVHFDFDAKIQNTRLTIKNEVYLFLQLLNDFILVL